MFQSTNFSLQVSISNTNAFLKQKVRGPVPPQAPQDDAYGHAKVARSKVECQYTYSKYNQEYILIRKGREYRTRYMVLVRKVTRQEFKH